MGLRTQNYLEVISFVSVWYHNMSSAQLLILRARLLLGESVRYNLQSSFSKYGRFINQIWVDYTILRVRVKEKVDYIQITYQQNTKA